MNGMLRRGLIPTAVLTCLLIPSLGSAEDSLPVPARAPSPDLGVEPWPGFRPWSEPAREFPLERSARWDRWLAYRRGAVPSLSSSVNPSPDPRTEIVSVTVSREESSEFEAGFRQALGNAQKGDGGDVLRELSHLVPQTVAGAEQVRQLAFAANVSETQYAAAESLFYRLSWTDGGRTATRLAAWRELAAGRSDAAAAYLESLSDPTPGEQAALALARWMESPKRIATPLTAPGSGLNGVAQTMVSVQAALMNRDFWQARSLLDDLDHSQVPDDWRSTVDLLHSLATGDGGASTADLRDVESITGQYLAGTWSAVDLDATTWLGAWPTSEARPTVFYMRAVARLGLGQTDGAVSDLKSATRNPALVARIRLAEAFVLAATRPSQALAALSNPGTLADISEPELLFHRARLARKAQAADAAASAQLTLEEGYPNSEWFLRSRADTRPEAWSTPWPAPLPTVQGSLVVEAPTHGPWGQLLWGEEFLATESLRLAERSVPISPGATRSVSELTYDVSDPAPGRRGESPRWTAGMRGGSPLALQFELGTGGVFHDLHYHAAGRQTFAEARGVLPPGERMEWELGLGAEAGATALGAVAERNRRREDPAGAVGLDPDPVDAGWFGVRGDVAWGDPADPAVAGAVSVVRGDLDAGRVGVWKTDQLWVQARGETKLHGDPLNLEGTVGAIQFEDANANRDRTYFDVKTTWRGGVGWFVGLRAAGYAQQTLILPVAGIEHARDGLRLWAATDPTLTIPSFRSVFVVDGDWNVPDWALPAVRRPLHLQVGMKWSPLPTVSLGLTGQAAQSDHVRSWRRDPYAFVETAVKDVDELRGEVSFDWEPGPVFLGFNGTWQQVQSGGVAVAYIPTAELALRGGYTWGRWSARGVGNHVAGRRTELNEPFGDFWRWDAEIAYRVGSSGLPLGARWLELSLRIENLFDAEDVRWPGVPGYGRGVYAGVRLAHSE